MLVWFQEVRKESFLVTFTAIFLNWVFNIGLGKLIIYVFKRLVDNWIIVVRNAEIELLSFYGCRCSDGVLAWIFTWI